MRAWFFIAPDCECEPGVPFKDGTKPKYYDSSDFKAVDQTMFYCKMGTTYWAVHVDGKHVLGVEVKGIRYSGIYIFRKGDPRFRPDPDEIGLLGADV